MFIGLETILNSYINTLSLEAFVLIASFVEEVIAPIPSPTVMVLAGSFATIQGYAMYALVLLACIGAVGKTIGAVVVYYISDSAEDFVLHKFGRFFNVTREEVDQFGSKLGKGAKDYLFLTMLRALPIMPSVLVSVGSGLLKVPLPLFVVSTFFGTIVRDSLYLYAGYVGTSVVTAFVARTTSLETFVEIISCIGIGIWGVYILRKRKKMSKMSHLDRNSTSNHVS